MVGKAVILAGGSGTCISEDTELQAEAEAEIGGRPSLSHDMRIHSPVGIDDERLIEHGWVSGSAPWQLW